MANVFDSETAYVVNNNIGLGGKILATAKLHIGASNGKSSSAPLKFDSGTSLVNPENGAVEFDGTHLYMTISGIRYQLDQQGGGGGVAWGNIQGTLSNQTDLQNALNLKLNLTGGTLSGSLSLGGNKIINLGTPTLSTDAVTKGYVDSIPAAAVWGNITGTLSNQTDLQSVLTGKEPTITVGTTLQYWRGDKTFEILNTSVVPEGSNLYFTNARVQANTLDSLAAPVSSLSLNSQNITNLLDPTTAQMAATKNYVDNKFPVSVGQGGTGVSSPFTSGSIIFSNGTTLAQDNANLFYDSTHKVLAIGTDTPNAISSFNSAGFEIDNTGGGHSDIVQRVAAGYGTHYFASSGGTIASPTVTIGGIGLGALQFFGYGGSSYITGGFIGLQASNGATFGSSSMPADIIFQNTLRKQVATSNNSFIITSEKTIGLWTGQNANSVSANLQIAQPGYNLPGVVQTNGTTALVGTETLFVNDFKIGDTINVQGETSRIVATITDNTHLAVTSSFSTSSSNLTYTCTGSLSIFQVNGNGHVGIGMGITLPTAMLHLPAGTAKATTSPLKFTAGTNLTTPEAGAMEWDGTNLYITQTSGPTRQTIAYTGNIVDSLTAGTGIFVSGGTGNVTVTNVGVTSIVGAASQIIASAPIGTVTLSLPQNIDTSSSPTFAGLTLNGSVSLTGKITKYNNVSTVAMGVPSIYSYGRSIAQTAAVASVSTYTNGAADGSFIISANVNVTTFSVGTFNVTVTYTDETNTSRTVTLNFSSITGTLGIAIAAAGAFEGLPIHIRVKALATITIATSGTFTSLTYNVESTISQVA